MFDLFMLTGKDPIQLLKKGVLWYLLSYFMRMCLFCSDNVIVLWCGHAYMSFVISISLWLIFCRVCWIPIWLDVEKFGLSFFKELETLKCLFHFIYFLLIKKNNILSSYIFKFNVFLFICKFYYLDGLGIVFIFFYGTFFFNRYKN